MQYLVSVIDDKTNSGTLEEMAAIDAFNELGLYTQVREIYGKLATLPLSDKRRARYSRLQERLSQMQDDRSPMASSQPQASISTGTVVLMGKPLLPASTSCGPRC